ncbi:EndoU domain-containing protein [Pseudomonas sp. CVAP|uniref:EndoU domain-containing protein n=1 Tax=Pseudomonas sp. CVAP\|nr:EndoU domain-containing protein [Pseudomonas sp. CVAP\
MRTIHAIAAGLATSLLSLSATAQINCAAGAAGVNPVPVQVSNVVIPNSRLNPQINQRHIFCGEINAGGNAVGFHSRPAGHDPSLGNGPAAPLAARTFGALVFIVPPGLNNPQPYRYMNNGVQIFNTGTNAWQAKAGPSTFFPESCTQQAVVESIRYAYMHLLSSVTPPPAAAFYGPSAPAINAPGYCVGENGYPFTISGYLNNIGGLWWVNTAFPIASF